MPLLFERDGLVMVLLAPPQPPVSNDVACEHLWNNHLRPIVLMDSPRLLDRTIDDSEKVRNIYEKIYFLNKKQCLELLL